MIIAIEPHMAQDYAAELRSMHRLRARVFADRLGWEVALAGGLEVDRYDALGPTHLVHIGPDGEVDGCARLLPTTGPTMIRDTFPVLLGEAPLRSGPHIWESSRFAVEASDRRDEARGLARITFELLLAEYEYALRLNLSEMVAVTDVRMERIMIRAGCRLSRLTPPQRLGVTRALAVYVRVDRDDMEAVRANAGVVGPVLAPETLPVLQAAA